MKLEIGMSFEVVEVLDNSVNAKIGQQGVNFGLLEDSSLYQNVCTLDNDFYVNSINQKTKLLLEEEIKPIGKLTVTKVK